MHDWLGMIPEEVKKQAFSNSRRRLTSDTHELEEVTSLIQTYTSWTEQEVIVYKVSSTSLMFNRNHGEDKMLLMSSKTSHADSHEDGIPQLCEQGDSIGRT